MTHDMGASLGTLPRDSQTDTTVASSDDDGLARLCKEVSG